MKFNVERVNKGDGKTFSEEAVYTVITSVVDYVNRMFARICKHGFDVGEPVDELEINITWKANSKEVDEEIINVEYPELLGFSTKVLADMIIKKAYGKSGK